MTNPNIYGRLLMTKRQGYYPNNWRAIKDAPDNLFPPVEYNDFMDWKMCGWELPSSVDCIIREQNLETGEVKEYTYATVTGGKKRAARIMKEGKSEFLVCTHDNIGHMFPKDLTKDNSIYDKDTNGTEYIEIDDDEELPF